MRSNPAKTFLMQYKPLSIQLDSIRREIQRKRESLTSISVQLKPDVIKGSGVSDRMAEAIAQIVDAEAQIADIVGQITKTQSEILESINSVSNETQKAVLMLRYVEGLDWISIQEKIGYERTQTLVLHGRALVEVNKWMEGKHGSKSN